jgi:hypothetical protein
MPTDRIHRFVLVVPQARVSAFNTWIKANIDPGGGDWLIVPLSPGGQAPATHAWAGFSATDDQARKLIIRLCQMANIAQPAGWDTMSRKQKIQWVASQSPNIFAAIGVWIEPADNEGDWPDPAGVLLRLGLLRAAANV